MIISIISIIAILFIVWLVIPKQNPKLLLDFKSIQLPTTPNYFLSCPKDYCNVAAEMQSPSFNIPAAELAKHLQQVISKQPRVTLLASNPEELQYTYLQRSKLMRYPDFINIKIIDLGNSQSSIAIFSQSKYGYSDLGVNAERVRAWINLLYTSAKRN